jgi:hypothetical protein
MFEYYLPNKNERAIVTQNPNSQGLRFAEERCRERSSQLHSSTTTITGPDSRALLRCHPNSKFFYSFFITSIFSRLHGVLNVGKKINNYTV